METQRIGQNPNALPSSPVASKTLSTTGANAKSLGTNADPALAQWLEQATAYYNAVMAGDPNTPKPSAEEWNSFLTQLQWAQQQMGYGQGAWDPGMGGGAPMGGGQAGQGNAFGGIPGTMDNWVYTQSQAQIGFTGNGTHDIWSNEIILDVAPVSAQVTVEYTTDTRFQPPEEVAKITVRDPATGTEAVYFVHDFDPAAGDTLEIRTPQDSQVTDTSGISTWNEFVQGAAAGSKPEASLPGVEQPDGSLLYEPEFTGETIDFWAQPGENQTHHVYADANISVKPSDEVEFRTSLDGQVIVEVRHSDGSTDTYFIKKGYKANVNVNEEYIKGEIPESIRDRVTLNGAANTSGGNMDGAAIVDALLAATGRTEAQLQSALDSSDMEMTVEEFKTALSEGKLTNPVDNKLLNFLATIDPGLKEMLNGLLEEYDDGDAKDATERVMELLAILDPNSIFTLGAETGQIEVNGDLFTVYLQDNGDLTLSYE